jgi:hypothetical protein
MVGTLSLWVGAADASALDLMRLERRIAAMALRVGAIVDGQTR